MSSQTFLDVPTPACNEKEGKTSSESWSYTSVSPSPSASSKDISLAGASGKTLTFKHASLHTDTLVQDVGGNAVYFADASAFTPGKADVTLHSGGDNKGPVLAVAKWSSMYSAKAVVGLGDPGAAGDNMDVAWEEMHAASGWKQNEHRWSIPVAVSGAGSGRKAFTWKRTHRVGCEKNRASSRNFKLVEEESGEVVAVYATASVKSWNTLGTLTFSGERELGERVERMALMTVLALIEKSRRRNRAIRANGGAVAG